jgi:hypothetical protein
MNRDGLEVSVHLSRTPDEERKRNYESAEATYTRTIEVAIAKMTRAVQSTEQIRAAINDSKKNHLMRRLAVRFGVFKQSPCPSCGQFPLDNSPIRLWKPRLGFNPEPSRITQQLVHALPRNLSIQ